MMGTATKRSRGPVRRNRSRPAHRRRRGRYIVFSKPRSRKLSLDGLKIVVDCAHGAAYRVAPTCSPELGAQVISLGVGPDGKTSTITSVRCIPEANVPGRRRAGRARRYRARRGRRSGYFADERGQIVDGDAIMALCATAAFGAVSCTKHAGGDGDVKPGAGTRCPTWAASCCGLPSAIATLSKRCGKTISTSAVNRADTWCSSIT